MIPSLKGFNEIEQQSDVCFLIADVNILCSYNANIVFKVELDMHSLDMHSLECET